MNIYLDGTWNLPKDKSNVYSFFKKYGGEYFSGPGTTALIGDTPFISKWLGGVFGFGTQAIVDRAYKHIRQTQPNQPLNIFGFSRGAAAARMLAAKVGKAGGDINFLGCWDTVGAFGIPVDIWPFKFQSINLFHDMHVHINVKHAAHAFALDEHRPAFVGTPMEIREGITMEGFNGDHWHVGSSDETYHWMLQQFEAV